MKTCLVNPIIYPRNNNQLQSKVIFLKKKKEREKNSPRKHKKIKELNNNLPMDKHELKTWIKRQVQQ